MDRVQWVSILGSAGLLLIAAGIWLFRGLNRR